MKPELQECVASSLLPFCCENTSPNVNVSRSLGKVSTGSLLVVSKRMSRGKLTANVVPKIDGGLPSHVIKLAGLTGKTFNASAAH